MAMTREEAAEVHETASAAYQSGDYEQAGELFSSLLIEPEAMEVSGDIQWNYALCLAHLGNWDLAVQHVQAAGYDEATFRETCAESGLTEPRYAHQLAQQLYQDQQWEAAAEAFVAVSEHPDLDQGALPEIRWNIAMSYAHLGEFETAFDHLAASGFSEDEFRDLARQSGVDFAEHDFAAASRLYEAGSYDAAADAFASMLLDPGVPSDIGDEIHWNLAMCLARLGNWEAAFGHIASSGGDEEEFRRRVADAGLEAPTTD